MKKILLFLTSICFSFNAWAKDVAVNEFKKLLEDRNYTFEFNPETNTYTGTKNELAKVLITTENNNVKGVMFAIDTNKDKVLSQEAMLNATIVLPQLVDDSEKASEFFGNCFVEAATKSQQKTIIEDKTFSFNIVGNLVVMMVSK
ncbi:MAG: hypothetical protein KHX55_03945 [Proteobacteria bacterium]|nr:hypothetical protein [Pseudomonadota bacterium]